MISGGYAALEPIDQGRAITGFREISIEYDSQKKWLSQVYSSKMMITLLVYTNMSVTNKRLQRFMNSLYLIPITPRLIDAHLLLFLSPRHRQVRHGPHGSTLNTRRASRPDLYNTRLAGAYQTGISKWKWKEKACRRMEMHETSGQRSNHGNSLKIRNSPLKKLYELRKTPLFLAGKSESAWSDAMITLFLFRRLTSIPPRCIGSRLAIIP